MKTKVIIAGCGFGGISALSCLGRFRKYADITVIDKRTQFSFLPALPDVLGRDVEPEALSCSLPDLVHAKAAAFVNAEVRHADLTLRKIVTDKGEHAYDFAIFATGSETNFYGNDALPQYARTLDSVDDAQQLRFLLETGGFESFVIAGGGYTGVEIATNIRRFLQRRGLTGRVLIVERSSDILGPLPAWMKEYTRENLKRMQVSLTINTTVEHTEGKQVRLSTGEVFNNALLIWCAGVRVSAYIQDMDAQKNAQGRVKVDPFLRVNDTAFVIGDAAQVPHKGSYLRMAIQFALAQGRAAAFNIMRSLEKKPCVAYRPVDLGYIIPMANNYSCGNVFGMNVCGKLATSLHYFMCLYRTVGLRNKAGFFKDLVKNLD